ncbi:hypothetical protein OQA88_13305 [Cercophora sp. LCS_1]
MVSEDPLSTSLDLSDLKISAPRSPRCLVCRDLSYLAAVDGGEIDQLQQEMAERNITESKAADVTKPMHQQEWPADAKPQYPTMPEYKTSAQRGCRCCAFVYLLYNAVSQLIMAHGFATVNGWGMGVKDDDIHGFVMRLRGTLRLRLTNVKWPQLMGRDLDGDVYTLGEIPNSIPFIRTTAPVASMTLQAMDAARGWLKQCRANHAKCNVKREGFMPRRLVQIIGSNISTVPCNPLVAVQFTEVPILKLVEPDEPVPYVALSYCWGANTLHWTTTTKSNIESHRKWISALTIPRTIAEAIQMARLLGFEYIWIDALCIVQDDVDDWTAEAARMGNVYGNAELVISANVTNDCTRPTAGFQTVGVAYQVCFPLDGFFDKVAPGVVWDESLGDAEFPSPATFTSRDAVVLRMAHLHSIAQAGVYRPLDARGWTCQESLLGRRMLSVTGFECLWTCDQGVDCECGESQTVLENQIADAKKGQMWESTLSYRPVQRLRRAAVEGRVTEDLPCLATMRNTWRQLVGDYTQRGLTVESDKLIAVSGMARVFGKVFSMLSQDWENPTPSYLAGIWRDNVHQDLLWFGQRFPQQMSAVVDLGGDGASLTASNLSTQQHQNDVANEPFEAAEARLKSFRDRPSKPAKYRAPSWSWASSNYCISWLLDITKWDIERRGGEHSTTMTPYMTLLSGQINATPDDYGAVASGCITVKAPLVEVKRRRIPLSAEDRKYMSELNVRYSPLIKEAATPEAQASVDKAFSQTADKAYYAFVRSRGGFIFDYFPDDEFASMPVARQDSYKCLFDSSQKVCQAEGCECKEGWSEESFWCLKVNRVVVREDSRPARIQDGWLVLKKFGLREAYERVGVGHFLKDGREAKEFRLFDDAVESVCRIV